MPNTEVPGASATRDRISRLAGLIKAGDLSSARRELHELSLHHGDDYNVAHIGAVIELQSGNLPQAQTLFLRALGLAPNPVAAAASNAGLSEALLAQGEPASAAIHAKRAWAAQRGNPNYCKLLARCYAGQGRVEDAVTLLHSAAGSAPTEVRQMLMLQAADILLAAGQAREGLEIIEHAEKIRPADPELLAQKAYFLSTLGRFDESDACYRQVVEIKPELPVYYAMAKYKPAATSDDRLKLFETKLSGAIHEQVELRTNLHFALATAYDQIDDVDRAFEHLERGSALKRGSLTYDGAIELEALAGSKSFFDRDFLARMRGRLRDPGGVTPIFILGMPRSGTTLVEQILGAHSLVKAAGELSFIGMLSGDISRAWGADARATPSSDLKILEIFKHAADRYRAFITRRAGGARFVTDKMPVNFRHLGLIEVMFPDAVVVHCRRNAMDTCFSCYQQLFETTNLPFSYDLTEIAGYYAVYRQYMEHWSEVLDPSPTEIIYESLIAEFETQVRELLRHCRLPYEDGCLEFSDSKRTVLTASATQVRRPLYASSIGKWRRYERHLSKLITSLGRYADVAVPAQDTGALGRS